MSIKIELVSKDEKKSKTVFDISGAAVSYVNTLRRLFMMEVPVLAIDEVEFINNSSGLYDEIVSNRLGFIPFKTDLKSYNLPEVCKCKGKGCARCQLIMTLKSKEAGVVYSSDIKTKDPKIKPVFSKIPITKLLEGQALELSATATMGLGKNHTKWSPCLAYYKELVNIKVEKQPDNKEEIAEQCPKGIFVVKNDSLQLVNDKVQDCILCNACIDLSAGKIKVEPNKTYRFTIESWGQLEPDEIVAAAIDAYDQQLEEFTELLAKIK
ncbi:MAG: DNA-directed RNA polymerase subunit D [archaeon]